MKKIAEHKCKEWEELTEKIEWDDKHNEYGNAIRCIIKYDDSEYWWASCNEYAEAIYFCPFCGIKL